MLLSCFLYLIVFAGVSFFLCIVGVLITYFVQGETIARGLLYSWIGPFNGLMVGAAGYGLMWFVLRYGRVILNQLNNILDFPEAIIERIVHINNKAMSWFWLNMVSIPLTIIGGFILWNCGYPLHGFAKIYLAISSISIYYVASSVLAFFIYSLWLFRYLEDNHKIISIRRYAFMIEFENLNTFFVISATVGIFAIYLGFRGTLTANFTYPHEIFRKILILPLILYLPVTLFYSFYPRYVLRRISEHDTLRKIETFTTESTQIDQQTIKDKLETEKLLLEIKEKLLAERKGIPLLSLKDSPSLFLTLLVIIQFIMQKDSVITGFIKYFLKGN